MYLLKIFPTTLYLLSTVKSRNFSSSCRYFLAVEGHDKVVWIYNCWGDVE